MNKLIMLSVMIVSATTMALWISVDGDNTGSNFDLRLERITLTTP